jgi:hypothetical protein
LGITYREFDTGEHICGYGWCRWSWRHPSRKYNHEHDIGTDSRAAIPTAISPSTSIPATTTDTATTYFISWTVVNPCRAQ